MAAFSVWVSHRYLLFNLTHSAYFDSALIAMEMDCRADAWTLELSFCPLADRPTQPTHTKLLTFSLLV